MQTWLLFYILLLLALGAVIAFSLTVIKPMQTRWAVRRGREIAASGEIGSRWRFDNVYRMLATAPHDREAAYLWECLRDIREQAEKS
ncbi:MAG: hypothetical protein ABID87_00290 [Chloroflexota bacterium]